jgi:hypothetical protein
LLSVEPDESINCSMIFCVAVFFGNRSQDLITAVANL